MFRFEHIEYLYLLLLLLPLGFLLYLGRLWYERQRRQLGDASLLVTQADEISRRQAQIQGLMVVLAFLFGIIALANPQWGAKREKVTARSTDIFLALDISNSMYCEDIAPNRLEQAKRFARRLVDKLKGERMGLILFAGNAYLQMPLTSDYAAAQLFIRSASPDLAGTQGTALEDAILTATENFEADKNYHKTLIIISDGEDHDTEAISTAREASDAGLSIFTIGVGTSDGSFIPIITPNGQTDWKRDVEGQPVRTRLNETLMRELAEAGNGEYFHISGEDRVLESIKKRVDQMEKMEYEERSFTAFESYYQLFLALSVLFFALQWIIGHNFIVSIRRRLRT